MSITNFIFKCTGNVLLLQRAPISWLHLQMAEKAVLPPQACCTSCWHLNLTRHADLKQTSCVYGPRPNLACCLLVYSTRAVNVCLFVLSFVVVVAVFAFPSVWEQSKRLIFCNTWGFCEIPISVSINATRLKYSHRHFCTVSGSFWTRKLKMFTIWCLAEEKIQGLLPLRNRNNIPWEMCEILNPGPDPRNDLECLI